jgi:hypothetical protein
LGCLYHKRDKKTKIPERVGAVSSTEPEKETTAWDSQARCHVDGNTVMEKKGGFKEAENEDQVSGGLKQDLSDSQVSGRLRYP